MHYATLNLTPTLPDVQIRNEVVDDIVMVRNPLMEYVGVRGLGGGFPLFHMPSITVRRCICFCWALFRISSSEVILDNINSNYTKPQQNTTKHEPYALFTV